MHSAYRTQRSAHYAIPIGGHVESTEDTVATTEVAAPIIAADDTVTGLTEVTAEGNTDDEDDGDPIEEAFLARLALEQEKLQAAADARARERIAAEQAEAFRRQTASNSEQTLRDALAETIKRSREGLRNITVYDDKGNASRLSDEVIEEHVAKPLQAYNAQVRSTERNGVYHELAQTTVNLLPETQREAFSTQAAGKPLDEWQKTYAELYAPNSDFVKQMQREVDVKVKAAEARGYAKGQKATGGTPRATGERPAAATGASFDLSTHSGLAGALAAGRISEAEYREKRANL